MPIKQLNPYLQFDGTAAQAIKLYESALGARTENVSRYGEMPGGDAAPELEDRIMHAVLRLDGGTLMLSDTQPHSPVGREGPVHVCLDFDDPADMDRKFEALSAGGKVAMAPQDTFWGARFGMLTDAFGIRWMFNCEIKQKG